MNTHGARDAGSGEPDDEMLETVLPPDGYALKWQKVIQQAGIKEE